ncbi:hypothetical protein FA95DRAFT_148546 [Auriscalpium vulgare]|uniref:Uncharacterized protein n=1 Tax=Auriscalpium vulgare TaxID=40419 RepID=A0ACB8S6C1_9AGAM|nr:hypothetical protein FA95DRAFT_148546 [Auriscalpium vulgare]
MSLSPTTPVSNGSTVPSKRRRSSFSFNALDSASPDMQVDDGMPAGHIPKRGARACTACRKGKNRCEGEVCGPLFCRFAGPPRSLRLARPYRPGPAHHPHRPPAAVASSPAPHVSLKSQRRKMPRSCLAPPSSQSPRSANIFARTHPAPCRRLSRLEGQYVVRRLSSPFISVCRRLVIAQVMQSQMIGMQSSLDRILAAVQSQGAHAHPGGMPPPVYPPHRDGPGYVTNVSDTRTGVQPQYDPALMQDQRASGSRPFPPLPGFAPPVCSVYFIRCYLG